MEALTFLVEKMKWLGNVFFFQVMILVGVFFRCVTLK